MDALKNCIAIEGCDYAGKSTICQLLVDNINHYVTGYNAELVQQPTGGFRKLIRSCIEGHEDFTPRSLFLLFAADRDVVMNKKGGIIDRVKSEPNTIFVFDRYNLSTKVYQSKNMNEHDHKNLDLFPNITTVVLDPSIETILERFKSSRDNAYESDIFESTDKLIETHRRYNVLGSTEPNCIHLDTSNLRSPDDIVAKILAIQFMDSKDGE